MIPKSEMTYHAVEDRRLTLSPYGLGNMKTGPGVYTYSKLPGRVASCPGSTQECEAVCYAKRMVLNPVLGILLTQNTQRGAAVPPLPADAAAVRIHISGDFDSVDYIRNWYDQVASRSDVMFWAYTRSWRVAKLLPELNRLRTLPNITIWASVDKTSELPPDDWPRAYIQGDHRLTATFVIAPHPTRWISTDGRVAITCPEQLGTKPHCQACKFCFKSRIHDLVFLNH